MRGAVLLGLLVSSLAQAQDDKLDKAKAYFQSGVQAYDQGNYKVALEQFGHAHALSQSPALYFNMAACEEHLDHFQAASSLLRQYLIEKPDADDRLNVEQRIKALDDRDEAQKKRLEATPTPTTPTPTDALVTPTPPPPKHKLKYTWVMLGVTGAVGIATIGVGATTVVRHNDLKNSCGATATGCTTAQVNGLTHLANATDALIAVTAVAAIGTIVAAVVETRRGRSHAARATTVAWDGRGLVF
jgi:tetratricopeptide (TPR) repeat protein